MFKWKFRMSHRTSNNFYKWIINKMESSLKLSTTRLFRFWLFKSKHSRHWDILESAYSTNKILFFFICISFSAILTQVPHLKPDFIFQIEAINHMKWKMSSVDPLIKRSGSTACWLTWASCSTVAKIVFLVMAPNSARTATCSSWKPVPSPSRAPDTGSTMTHGTTNTSMWRPDQSSVAVNFSPRSTRPRHTHTHKCRYVTKSW